MLTGSRNSGFEPFNHRPVLTTPGYGGPLTNLPEPLGTPGIVPGAMPGLTVERPAVAPAATEQAGGGIFDRIKGFLQSDEGRAALLRSAGATLQGGLGAGIATGAGYMDQQKGIAAAAQQRQFENSIATRGADLADLRQKQNDDLGWAGVNVNMRQLFEQTRSNKAREGLELRGQNVQVRGQDVTRANAIDGNNTTLTVNRERIAEDARQSDNQIGLGYYGQNLDYLSSRGPAGIGSKGGYTETRTKTPAVPATDPWIFGTATPAQPETVTTTRTPVSAPAAAAPQGAIDALKANPNLRAEFERKFGAGSAAQWLGGR